MSRNIEKIAADTVGTINPRYDLTVPEAIELVNEARANKEATGNAILTAFRYGYEMGRRAEKAAHRPAPMNK